MHPEASHQQGFFSDIKSWPEEADSERLIVVLRIRCAPCVGRICFPLLAYMTTPCRSWLIQMQLLNRLALYVFMLLSSETKLHADSILKYALSVLSFYTTDRWNMSNMISGMWSQKMSACQFVVMTNNFKLSSSWIVRLPINPLFSRLMILPNTFLLYPHRKTHWKYVQCSDEIYNTFAGHERYVVIK